MAAVTSALIAIAGVVLGWIAIEIACKPCLEKGREAIDRSLNPDYDPDDDEIRIPINPPSPDLQEQPNPRPDHDSSIASVSSATAIKAV
ncbi:hypothetical protein SADUNF_Sadunf11G0052600 [Salix dunnii]|uniref:Outer envelope membrane protein 7 n=1 Tax=Salix dunnii TaxID=1413687 RepID=A0A835JLN3_9ROSI|nr:hypothetical protein SADUNF_Sadunf11G0052600 [Salix dunnii]